MACSWPISCISSNTRGLSSQGYGPFQSDCWLSNTMAGRQVHGYHTRSASLPCEACSWNEDLVKSPNLEPAPPDSAANYIQLWQNVTGLYLERPWQAGCRSVDVPWRFRYSDLKE